MIQLLERASATSLENKERKLEERKARLRPGRNVKYARVDGIVNVTRLY
jgi:hypothetical protein